MIKLKNLISEAVPNILTSNIKQLDIVYTDRGKFYKMNIIVRGGTSHKIVSLIDANSFLEKLGAANELPRIYNYNDVELAATELPKNIKVSHSDTMDIS